MEVTNEQPTFKRAGVPLLALSLPLLLWPVELWLPYPALIEETTKLGIVWLVVRTNTRGAQAKMILLCGGLLAASEAFLYLINAAQYGNLAVFWWRLVLTGSMHLISLFVLWWGVRERLGWAGWATAVLWHWSFNQLAAGWG
ncbi:hypothetical protein A2W24_02435 [Microgenomates group bacterium RBG_16_45_19]|nr:MAG: hypothetical protein A2W24_02435 [Microgenomates group bacterium RBG_16_45_19]